MTLGNTFKKSQTPPMCDRQKNFNFNLRWRENVYKINKYTVVTEFHSYYSLPIFTVGSGVSGPSGIVSPALAIELRPDQAPFLVCNSRLVMHDS